MTPQMTHFWNFVGSLVKTDLGVQKTCQMIGDQQVSGFFCFLVDRLRGGFVAPHLT